MAPQLPDLLAAWTTADSAARHAEDKVRAAVREQVGQASPGPSQQLLAATARLRAIANERFDKLQRVSLETRNVDHSAPGELAEL